MIAEYYALSTAMREVLPLRNLIKAVARGLKINEMCDTQFRCTAHEDNSACETLTNLEPGRVTPRSKFYDVRVHWFRSLLNPPPKEFSKSSGKLPKSFKKSSKSAESSKEDIIEVVRCDTKAQRADIYTKVLGRDDFERLRKMICGW